MEQKSIRHGIYGILSKIKHSIWILFFVKRAKKYSKNMESLFLKMKKILLGNLFTYISEGTEPAEVPDKAVKSSGALKNS